MVKLTIDGKEHEFDNGLSVIQACEQIGIEIPRFCYHPRLKIAGNCRMCLVDLEGSPKPIPSCATPVRDGMVIHTNNAKVKHDREAVMEFLLINHPLDCPVCDQGGECDLQDQALYFGKDYSRYKEEKRIVCNKNLGPLIGTIMNRCILCMRCVRFGEDIAGVTELGATGRGEKMEIASYLESAITSELSGNMIDVCPVGALNSIPYQFHGRPWEIKKTNSIDVMDAVGAHIRIDHRGGEVLRIKPRECAEINEEWLGDKSRFAYDGLLYQRLDIPYVRVNGRLQPSSWEEAYKAIASKIKKTEADHIAAIAGELVDCESMAVLKNLMGKLGSPHMDTVNTASIYYKDRRCSYIFNTGIAATEKADFCLLIGSNPRQEAPIINVRLRKAVVKNGMKVYRIGDTADLTYPVTELGNDLSILNDILKGEGEAVEALKKASYPMLIIGQGALRSNQASIILKKCADIVKAYNMVHEDGWNGFNVLHTSAAQVGAIDLGFIPGEKGFTTPRIIEATHNTTVDVVYLLGADEVATELASNTFVIYQGHHGGSGASRADVILPGCAYTEKSGMYVNTEGRSQCAEQAVDPVGEAKEDWKILTELAGYLGIDCGYADIEGVHRYMVQLNPEFSNNGLTKMKWTSDIGVTGEVKSEPVSYAIPNYYMTNIITKCSKTMAVCVRELLNGGQK